ncbi:F-box protein PP2-B10-like [Dioscorea cayenensis subsp. rotundata]|uniref:F-box protein PP2-B10-like n=1 Tax=Dioscorea cayennensis subsp. rotundata TaxID=55577 RepID=A0AB40AP56_DIOCR|nr:F-box protein PP2-B10-like [Dioscorea cayenensis subsp. rotundata]
MAGEKEMAGVDFSTLPEGCISHVLSLTSPLDACRAAMVSPVFRSAEASDTVWERFLPSDIAGILARAVDRVQYSSKRDLFFRLCGDPILIDDRKMSFFLDRMTGRKCYLLSARLLTIVWGDTPSYWRWIDDPNSRFSEVAELLDVCWLEIRGQLDTKELSPHTKYVAYLVFNLTEATRGLEHPSQETSVKVGAQVSSHTTCLQTIEDALAIRPRRLRPRRWIGLGFGPRLRRTFIEPPVLEPPEQATPATVSTTNIVLPRKREDDWMEIELGQFDTDCGDVGEVDMSFMEVKGGFWKSGLIVQGIEIRPTN